MRKYNADEERVCDYLRRITDDVIGCGDDPISFLIASHGAILRRSTLLKAVADAAEGCLHDDRHVGGEVSFQMGGHRRIRLADALKALKE